MTADRPIVLTLVGLILLASVDAHATSILVAPRRPLNERQKLEYAAARSETILRAKILAARDSTVTVPMESGRPFTHTWLCLTLEPHAAIKGDLPDGAQIVYVDVDDEREFSLFLRQHLGRELLCFLHKAYVTRDLAWVPASVRPVETSPFQLATNGLEDSLRIVLSEQTTESLARRADIVMIGWLPIVGQFRTPAWAPCVVDGDSTWGCQRITVGEVLAGHLEEKEISVHGLMTFGEIPVNKKAVFFLKREPKGVYGVLSSGASMVEPNEDVLATIQRARHAMPRLKR